MKPLSPNNLGKKYLVEQCRSINISDYLNKAKSELKECITNSQLESDGYEIELITSKTNFNGTRLWFKCPLCEERVGVLYKHPFNGNLGCRRCLNLEYKCRKYKGMVESTLK